MLLITVGRHLFLTLFYFSLLAAAQCYFPNGTDRNDAFDAPGRPYQQCPGTKMCCRTAGDRLDVCDPQGSGLCISDQTWWRESCVDRTWNDPGCIKLFVDGPDGSGNRYSGGDVAIFRCDDGTWCPSNSSKVCCDRGQGVRLVNGAVVTPSSKSSSTSAVSITATSAPIPSSAIRTSSASSPAVATISATATSQPQGASLNGGAVAAGVVGTLLGVSLIAGLTWFIMRRKSQVKVSVAQARSTEAELPDNGFKSTNSLVYHHKKGTEKFEMMNSQLPTGMPAGEHTSEGVVYHELP